MRSIQVLGITVFGSLAFAASSRAGLSGSAMTGSLRFVGNTNFFDPANGRVPAGFGNSSSTSVTVGDPGIEFGFEDSYGRITADFTNTRLTLSETAKQSTDATVERYGFTDTAFAGLTPVRISNSYPVSATAGISGNTLQIALPDGYPTTLGDTTVLNLAITLPGDADLSGTVNFNDFLVLQTNFNAANTTFQQGNFDGNGQTDFNDFLILQTNFGQSVNGPAVAASPDQLAAIATFAGSNAVPEPATLGWVTTGGLMLRRRRVAEVSTPNCVA